MTAPVTPYDRALDTVAATLHWSDPDGNSPDARNETLWVALLALMQAQAHWRMLIAARRQASVMAELAGEAMTELDRLRPH